MTESIEKERPSFKEFLPACLILLLVGAAGLTGSVIFMLPTIGPRWLFFFSVVLFISGLVMPIVFYLNLRFPSDPPAEKNVIIRQSLWIGIFISVLAWLQLGRALNLPLGAILGVGFILVEMLLRMWERSRWKPDQPKL